MKICEINKCTGCSACVSICPTNCISLSPDDMGCMKYEISNVKCIECKRCLFVCPELNRVKANTPLMCFAAWKNDLRERHKSSSGGVATSLYEHALNIGYEIVGTVFEKGEFSLKYSDKKEDISRFRGSKYVYSNPQSVFITVQERLKCGIGVLFVGLPCQVAGLRNYLSRDYEDLITVDLICHGAPPVKYLQEHIEECIDNVLAISFRDGSNFAIKCLGEDNKILFENAHAVDSYLLSFLRGIIYAEVCYSCIYAKEERVSDMTIGDFWGIGKLQPYSGPREHVSLILVNTEKGDKFLNENRDLLLEERPLSEAVQGNSQLRSPSLRPKERASFVRHYPKRGFRYAIRKSGIGYQVKKNRVLICLSKIRNSLFQRKKGDCNEQI